MMRTVLFTGAGASRAIGYPLTSDLLPRTREGLRNGTLFSRINGRKQGKRDRDHLRQYLRQLLPGFGKARSRDLPLITDVFSLVEHALASGEALPIGGDRVLRHCRDLLKQAITCILMDDFNEPWNQAKRYDRQQQATLQSLAKWIRKQGADIGIVTTNYDIGLEYVLYEELGRDRLDKILDLGFDWRDADSDKALTRPANAIFRVYKLHGSLDLLRCPLCGHVYFNRWDVIAGQHFRPKLTDNNTCICADDARLELHIVSPSLVREVREANLLSVWRSAFEWMRTADRWIIVGYSLPPEDLAVRSLLLRAYAAAPRRPEVTVVQMGNAEKARYRLLFPACKFKAAGLESFLSSQ